MRTVLVLFDSLNRMAMGCYGGTEVETPNFDRFAKQGLTFKNHFVGSLPCMPARRDLHSGRLNFMHRSWGPLEPFDNSFVQILKNNNIHSHLVSDHLHYFEDGGSGFHTRFNTFDFIRGQEYDPWIAMVEPPIARYKKMYSDKHHTFDKRGKRLQHLVNRGSFVDEKDFPGPKCFASAFDFLDRNQKVDNWFLMLECFDPHEPFHAPDRFKKAYDIGYESKILDWPHYDRVTESEQEMKEIRANYCALVAMCDDYFGRFLDYIDRHEMWKDTAIILTTDHGFLLGEHEWWGKCRMPYYEEISHIPLIFYDPRNPEAANKSTEAITQTADLMPTILKLNDQKIPSEVLAFDLEPILKNPEVSGRDFAVFGVFGGPIGVSDGTYVLYYYPPDIEKTGLREYTLMPSHMTGYFTSDELRTAELFKGFDFTKGIPVLSIAATKDAKRVPNNDGLSFDDLGTRLFNISTDPKQSEPIYDQAIVDHLIEGLKEVLKSHDTPLEVWDWYGLSI